MNKFWSLFFACILLLSAQTQGFASSGGIIGTIQVGCTCHGNANSATSLSIPGRSSAITVKAGETLSLSLMVAHSSQTRAGFNLGVKNSAGANAGTLLAGSGSQLIAGELTHTAPQAISSGAASFPFQWTAPSTPGTYTLRAVGNAVNGDGGTGGDAWNSLAPITITVEDATPTTFTISGRILNPSGVAVAGVNVSDGTRSAVTDAQGNYTISGVPNGTYTLTPSLANWIFEPTTLRVTVSGANLSGQNITGRRLWVVTGQILNPSGVAVVGANVVARNGTIISSTATTDAQGNYTLWVVNGNYAISANQVNWVFEPTSTSVAVNGANVERQNITGRRLWAVTGQIVNPNNEPVANVSISAALAGASASSTATTDAQGNYTLWLVNGTYTLTPSRTNWTFNPSTLAATVNGANLTLDRITGRLVMSVKNGAEIALRIAPNPASEQVRVFYTISSPQRIRYEVVNLIGERVRFFEEFEAQGTHEFVLALEDMPTGVYFVRISGASGLLGSASLLVEGK